MTRWRSTGRYGVKGVDIHEKDLQNLDQEAETATIPALL